MKATKVFVSILSVIFIAALGLIIVRPATASGYSVVISDDATGGNCTQVGEWNATTKTCKLTEDIDVSGTDGDGITIASDGITLLCDGHSIKGDGSGFGLGIVVDKRLGVTVSNCNVQNFGDGIYLSGGYNTIENNIVNSNRYGIILDSTFYNIVQDNAANLNYFGIYLFYSDYNRVNDNTFNAGVFGIYLIHSNSNGVQANIAKLNSIGMSLYYSDSNTVYKNSATSNKQRGFFLGLGSNFNTLNNNVAEGNLEYGFYNDNSSVGNIYNNNECFGNAAGGAGPTGLCSPQP